MKQREKVLWITARVVTEQTGLNSEQMRTLRKNNPGFYKLSETGGYLYNAEMIKPLKKETA